jgi:hypothetical protein
MTASKRGIIAGPAGRRRVCDIRGAGRPLGEGGGGLPPCGAA